MIFRLFRKETEQEKTANLLYDAIVAQARQPDFYHAFQVEDSLTGRFEMIVLHAYMLFHRLRDEDKEALELGQAVFDRFFRDMDDSLREIGVGDLSVPKKIKKMAQSFYGRVEAYDAARADSTDALADALARNIFPECDGKGVEAQLLAHYVLENAKTLAAQPMSALASGDLSFADIPAVPDRFESLEDEAAPDNHPEPDKAPKKDQD